MKKYHHFKYERAGELKCQYVRGEGDYQVHKMKQLAGVRKGKDICGVCGDDEDPEAESGRTWVECEKCEQWYHCDCIDFELDDNAEASYFIVAHLVIILVRFL